MRFIPKKADDSVNVSDEHPLVEAGTLVIGLGLIFVGIMVVLIFMVDVALYFVPEEKEIEMFDAWLPEDITTVSHNDPRLARLEGVLYRLSRHWPESKYDFRVEIDDSEIMNAMAYPGGLIIVTTGLLDRVESENELAFILGHELGHFHNRDHLRGLGRGVVLTIMFATLGFSDADVGVGSSLANLTLRGFSRNQEADADAFGLSILNDEYGHVGDAWRFFERIGSEDDDMIDLLEYVATHPSPEDRIQDLLAMASENDWATTGEIYPINWEKAPD